jgi:hypothetical protein
MALVVRKSAPTGGLRPFGNVFSPRLGHHSASGAALMVKKARKPRKVVYNTPEKAKNGRNRRKVLLNQAETGKNWRYGIDGQGTDFRRLSSSAQEGRYGQTEGSG